MSYEDGWYTVHLPARELRLLTDMLIEGIEQFDDGLIAAQIGVPKADLTSFMLEFTGAM